MNLTLKQKNLELAIWKLSGNHPAVERAKTMYPEVAKMMLYEKGRTPKRKTDIIGKRWKFQKLPYGAWVSYQQTHRRQPLNGKRPLLIGWPENVTNNTEFALFIWNL